MRKLIYLLIFCSGILHAQQPEEAVKKLYNDFPQEKVVINFSKQDYLAGETIFFKAYNLTGYYLSDISTNLYVQLLDKNKKVIDQDILPVFKGAADGSFVLPSSIAENVYFIRAYTRWMLNFPEKYQFLKPVKIYNPYSSNKLFEKTATWTPSVFAESGILLSGLAAQISVKLSGAGKLPDNWKAVLLDKKDGSEITSVSSLNPQIASLNFIPQPGKEYMVRVTDDKGVSKEADVPLVKEEGISLQVRSVNDRIGYKIVIRKAETKGEGFKLVGTIHDEVVYSAIIRKAEGIINGSIEMKGLPTGVLRLTVFDNKEQPVAERLTFINSLQPNIIQPQIAFDTLSFAAKAKNSWKLPMDTTTWMTYAMQVEDATYPAPANFLANIYLSSDFQNIYDPSWYFDETSSERAAALDAYLLTETWGRFNWNDILTKQFPIIKYVPDKYLTYKGTVTRRRNMQAINDLNLLFQGKDSAVNIAQVKLDSSGSFYMTQMAFTDTMNVVYQLNSKKYNARDIKVDFTLLNTFQPYNAPFPETGNELIPRKNNEPLPAHIIRAAESKANIKLAEEKYKVMKTVIIKTTKKSSTQELDEKLSSGMFSTADATLFDFVNNPRENLAYGYTNILEWLRGRVPGLTVERDETGTLIPFIRQSRTSLFVDEVQVQPDYLEGFPVADIALIKVIRGVFLGVAFGSQGAIAIYTRRGDMGKSALFPGMPSSRIVGYRTQPKFFAPDYASGALSDYKDTREIMFWSPLLIPDFYNNAATIKFNNNDIAKSLRVIVTGFSNTGEIIYMNKVISQ